MSIVKWLLVAVAVGIAVFVGCSQDDRDEIAERGGNALRALNGESSTGEKTPRIVKEQQRKERIRQNNTWTPENQAKHPVEYLQAQLAELDRHTVELQGQAHKYATAKSKTARLMADDEAKMSNITNFLSVAKAAYRAADAVNRWPVTINGFTFSKEKAQEKIVDAAQKIPLLQSDIGKKRNLLAKLEKNIDKVAQEQRSIVQIKERIQNTINDANLKKVLDSDKGIGDALNAINDSLGSLSVDYDDPSVEELIVPDKTTVRQKEFDAIMAE